MKKTQQLKGQEHETERVPSENRQAATSHINGSVMMRACFLHNIEGNCPSSTELF